jgi:hypothetical protein
MSLNPRPLPRCRIVLSVGAFLLVLAVTQLVRVTVVFAAPAVSSAPLDVALRYEATAECPEREAFLDLVRLRAPHVRLLEPDPTPAPLLEVVVVLSEHPRGAAGEARILLDGRVRDKREFLGVDCLEVAQAAALSVSFVLERWRVDASPPKPAPEAAIPAPAPAGPEVAQPPADPAQPQVPANGAGAPSSAVRFDVALAPVAASLLDRAWLLGGGLSFGARSARQPRYSARLSLLAALSGESDGAASRYRWVVGEALLCPFRIGDEWSLSPCAHGLAGVLYAEGDAIDIPVDVAVSWFAAGPSLKGSVSMGPQTRLVAIVSASVPLAQRSFVFERPHRVVTQTRSIGWLVSAGVEHDIGGS